MECVKWPARKTQQRKQEAFCNRYVMNQPPWCKAHDCRACLNGMLLPPSGKAVHEWEQNPSDSGCDEDCLIGQHCCPIILLQNIFHSTSTKYSILNRLFVILLREHFQLMKKQRFSYTAVPTAEPNCVNVTTSGIDDRFHSCATKNSL